MEGNDLIRSKGEFGNVAVSVTPSSISEFQFSNFPLQLINKYKLLLI